LYTPNPFEQDSSLSHIDPVNNKNIAQSNLLMQPQYSMGQVFRSPGTLLKGMLQDMRQVPPLGKPTAAPSAPTKVTALVSNGGAILTFSPPNNYRGSHITSYKITGLGSSYSATADSSPFAITGLINGKSYAFSIKAINALGSSPAVTSNSVTPQSTWRSQVIDNKLSTSHISSTMINGTPTLAYADSSSGQLRIAQLTGGVWRVQRIDGPGTSGSNKSEKMGGPVSICTSTMAHSHTPILNLFYLDTSKKYLHYASFNGKQWSYAVVDGNGSGSNPDDSSHRGRTGSDISTSNSCVASADSVKVFYRDENLGLLLGATLKNGHWSYEVIDGDSLNNGRTKGDVGNNISSVIHGKYIYLFYSSVNAINPPDQVTQEDVRLASEPIDSTNSWSYKTISSDPAFPVQGISLSITENNGKVIGDWLASSAISLTMPDTIFSVDLTNQVGSNPPDISSFISNLSAANSGFVSYGVPGQPIIPSIQGVYYSCSERICEIDPSNTTSNSGIRLVTSSTLGSEASFTALTINNREHLFANLNGILQDYSE
jgi:hypothetical protein